MRPMNTRKYKEKYLFKSYKMQLKCGHIDDKKKKVNQNSEQIKA